MPKTIQISPLNVVKNTSKLQKLVDLPSELYNPYRLLILNDLFRIGFSDFSQLKESTGVSSDGNLASHLRYLEKNNLIIVTKSFAGKYPKTFYELTNEGKTSVKLLIAGLDAYLSCLKRD